MILHLNHSSSSFNIKLLNNGDNGPPFGAPSSVMINIPFIITPLCRYFRIKAFRDIDIYCPCIASINLSPYIFLSNVLLQIPPHGGYPYLNLTVGTIQPPYGTFTDK